MKVNTVVPALPGFYVVEPVYGDNGPDGLVRESIVAWIIVYDFDKDDGAVGTQIALPVTCDCAGWDNSYVLETPEQYVIPFDRSFDLNERDKVAEYFAKRWREERERRERKQA